MRKIIYLAVVCLSLLSCTEDKMPGGMAFGIPPSKPVETHTISASVTSLSFSADGGSENFTITSNFAWKTINTPSWITVSPTNGTSGTTSLTITVDKNTDTSSRTGTITFGESSNTVNISVSQSAATVMYEITSDVTSLNFTTYSHEKLSTNITSNFDWKILNMPSWIRISPISGSSGTTTISVLALSDEETPFDGESLYDGAIIIGDSTKVTLSIPANRPPGTSNEAYTLWVNEKSLEFTADGGSQDVNVRSNTSWQIKNKPSWVTLSSTISHINQVFFTLLTITADKNIDTSSRSGTIEIESEESLLQVTISVSQAAASQEEPSITVFSFVLDNGVTLGMLMVNVEGGTFTMGATNEQSSDASDDEKPTHTVTLDNYMISQTEVTQELWEAVMGQKPTSDSLQWKSYFGLGNNYPAYYVSWNDCQNFIKKLNTLTDKNFRLPTEAEWEFAARGGNKSRGYKYAGSNTIDDVAWYEENDGYVLHEVRRKSANELGLYDMSGNVAEWCYDWYGSYSSYAETNPIGPSTGSERVCRGGGWGLPAYLSRVSSRGIGEPDFKSDCIGLRLVLDNKK